MDLYDKLLSDTQELLSGAQVIKREYSPADARRQTQKAELIFAREAAFELGGSSKPAVNYTCFTDNCEIVGSDEILLCGPDLCDIKGDCAFARIALLSIKSDEAEDSEAEYRRIKEMEFAKYHVFPEGYMIRLSPESHREQVRVSRKALSDGISFFNVGSCYINEYKKNPDVLHVKLIFVTDPAVNFKALSDNAYKAAKITNALSSILSGMANNCSSCELKEICDEVEGLREIHFGQNKKK